MSTRTKALMATIVSLAVNGCATTEMIVEKVPPPTHQLPPPVGPRGIRYSLPKPFLLATPDSAGNGAFKIEVVYLPDECNTYAIDAKTKRGNYNLTVKVKEGLLSEVVWTEKDAEVLAESLKSGGEILKAELERVETEKKEKEKKAEEAKKLAEADLKALEKTVNDKQLELNLAAVEEAAAQAAIDEGDQSDAAKKALREAQLKLEKARAARDFAQKLLDDSRASVSALSGSFNKATPTSFAPKPGVNESLFWSPVLYAIDDTGGAVRLRAVDWKSNPEPSANPTPTAPCRIATAERSVTSSQRELLTSKPPKPPEAAAKPPKVLGSTDLARIWQKGALRFTTVLDKPINGLLESARTLSEVTPTGLKPIPKPPFQISLGKERQSIRVEFPGPPLQEGKYQLEMPYAYGDNKSDSVTVTLTVQR